MAFSISRFMMMTSFVSVSELLQIECLIAVMVTDQSVALVMVNDGARLGVPVVTEEMQVKSK